MTKTRQAYMMLLLTAFGWALSTIIIKATTEAVPAFHLMTGRFGLALVLFYVFKGRTVKLSGKALFHGSYLGIFLFFAYYLAIASLEYTTASKSGFLVALSVLWVPIVQLIIRRKRPNRWVALCVVTSLLGLYWISGLDGIGFNYGDALAVGCSVAYTLYILAIDAYAKEMDEDQMTLSILLVVTIVSVIMAVSVEGFSGKILLDNWVPIAVIGVFGTALSTYFQTKAQQVASPESVGIILLGEPLFTLVMALTILGEKVTTLGLLGGALLLLSLCVAIVKKV
ncbi:DMT family transporter [Fusibacter sp. JL298sf-3]